MKEDAISQNNSGDLETLKDTPDLDNHNPSTDRVWAWMVYIGALMMNIIYDRCSYSFGIFFTNFLTYFGDTRSHTACIGSLFFSVPLLCGPIAALTTRKIGYRKSTMIGGLIASVGFSCGDFSNSVTILCVTYGLISGFGISLPYFSSVVVDAVYFKKKRALATGIAESGAGVGTVIFAPLTNYLISVYGWRGALLIVGGIIANIAVCGTLFRPLLSAVRDKNITEQTNSEHTSYNGIEQETDKRFEMFTDAAQERSIEGTNGQLTATGYQYDNRAVKEFDNLHNPDAQEIKIGKGVTKLNTEIIDFSKAKHGILVRGLSKYIANTDTLTNGGFILFSISNFVMYFWYDLPYVFLVDKAVSMNVSDTNEIFLISIIEIVHPVGNISYGYLGDKEQISKTFLYGVSIILCGISVTLIPLFTEYPPLAVLAGLFGLFSAANEAMCSILIQVVGLDNLNQSYGVI